MKIYSPIISGSFLANILSGSFDVNNQSGSIFTITTTGLIGINKANPSRSLDVGGTISATTYYGDGSQLTGIGSSLFPFSGSATISGSLIVNGALLATEKSFAIEHQAVKAHSQLSVQ